MTLFRVTTAVLALAGFALPQSLHAEAQSKPKSNGPWQLTRALYYDCEISQSGQPLKPIELDVVYLEFAGQSVPQVNFFDPTDVVFEKASSTPARGFLFSRMDAGGRLFLWVGKSDDSRSPNVDAEVRLTPDSADVRRNTISVTSFRKGAGGTVTAVDFAGTCHALSGKDAWDLFQKAHTK